MDNQHEKSSTKEIKKPTQLTEKRVRTFEAKEPVAPKVLENYDF